MSKKEIHLPGGTTADAYCMICQSFARKKYNGNKAKIGEFARVVISDLKVLPQANGSFRVIGKCPHSISKSEFAEQGINLSNPLNSDGSHNAFTIAGKDTIDAVQSGRMNKIGKKSGSGRAAAAPQAVDIDDDSGFPDTTDAFEGAARRRTKGTRGSRKSKGSRGSRKSKGTKGSRKSKGSRGSRKSGGACPYASTSGGARSRKSRGTGGSRSRGSTSSPKKRSSRGSRRSRKSKK